MKPIVRFAPESAVVDALVHAGAERVLLVCQAGHRAGADRLARCLDELCIGIFDGAVAQVPSDVAAAAVEAAADADWIVAHGGGTAIGVAKAIALQRDVRIAAVPTTYAGSERTNIWGITSNGVKTTGRDDRVRPSIVVYDAELTVGLPVPLSLKSLLNALAHSIEALYAVDAEPEARQFAADSVGWILEGMRGIHADPSDLDARDAAQRGASLAAAALDGASMALHHKLAHVLGGSFGTAHADTHATLLPYTAAFNLSADPRALEAVRSTLGDDPGAALYDLMRQLGLPTSLKTLGLSLDDLGAVADGVLRKQYANPRETDRDALVALLTDAWHDRRPSLLATRSPGPQQPISVYGARTGTVLFAVHGRGSNADRFAHDLGHANVVAAQAPANSWYPRGFKAPIADNQPQLDHALETLDAAWALTEGADRVVAAGFSQGACLLLTWLGVRGRRPDAVIAMTGATLDLPLDYDLDGVPVHVGTAEQDPWVELADVQATVDVLRASGADVTLHITPGAIHAMHAADRAALKEALDG